MIPDLGKYAGTVIGAYAVTIGLIALLVVASWRQAARARAELDRLESARRTPNG